MYNALHCNCFVKLVAGKCYALFGILWGDTRGSCSICAIVNFLWFLP